MLELWLLVIASALGTYAWRGLGAFLSGRIAVASELSDWIACVAYAMLAGLMSRIVFMPTGMLAATLLADRLIACAVAVAAYHLARRNLLVAVAVGVATMVAITVARGTHLV